jgi:hypothetical protein
VAQRLRLRYPHFTGAECILIDDRRARDRAPRGAPTSGANIGRLIRRTTQTSSLGLAPFVADDSANGRFANGSDGADVCKKGTARHIPLTAPIYGNPSIPSVR